MDCVIKFLIIIAFFLFPSFSFSKMESENFSINADVIGIGGESGSSLNYILTDTLGEEIIGTSNSDNFTARQGLWYMLGSGISMTINSNSLNLGTVTPGESIEGQSVIGVTTDSWGGYDLYISENHSLLHVDASSTIADYSCVISSPCSWSSNGFGFTIKSGTGVDVKWGSNPNYNYAAVPTNSTKFHDKTGYTSGADDTIVSYKTSVSSTQKAGVYSNIITFVAMEKL